MKTQGDKPHSPRRSPEALLFDAVRRFSTGAGINLGLSIVVGLVMLSTFATVVDLVADGEILRLRGANAQLATANGRLEKEVAFQANLLRFLGAMPAGEAGRSARLQSLTCYPPRVALAHYYAYKARGEERAIFHGSRRLASGKRTDDYIREILIALVEEDQTAVEEGVVALRGDMASAPECFSSYEMVTLCNYAQCQLETQRYGGKSEAIAGVLAEVLPEQLHGVLHGGALDSSSGR